MTTPMTDTSRLLKHMKPGEVYGTVRLKNEVPDIKDPISVLNTLCRNGSVRRVSRGRYIALPAGRFATALMNGNEATATRVRRFDWDCGGMDQADQGGWVAFEDYISATAVTLKPLEWQGVGDTIHASAYGIDRAYLIEGTPGDWSLRYVGNRQEERVDGFETQAAAKQAAWDMHRDKAASQLTTLPAAHAAQTLLADPGAILVGHDAMAAADDEGAPGGKPDYDELLTVALTAIRANCA